MASTYLTRTYASAGGGVYKWTYSFWIKRSQLGEQTIVSPFFSTSFFGGIKFTSSDTLEVFDYRSSYILQKITNRVFRDTSAWYHIVVANDNSVSSPDLKIYINGVQETSFGTDNEYSQNETTSFNNDYTNTIGAYNSGAAQHVSGCLSHFHYIDGTAYDADTFGETDATTGIWKPKTAPSVTYGTNGFFLKFENSGSMGTDSSGNANNFTVNGTMTQTIDTPSNVFATFNPLTPNSNNLQYGGLRFLNNSGTYDNRLSTLAMSKGKYYAEFKMTDLTNGFGIAGIQDVTQFDDYNFLTFSSRGYGYRSDGTKGNNSSSSAFGATFTSGDIIMIAVDLDNNFIYAGKNGTWQNSGDPTSGATGTGAMYSIASGYDYCFGAASTDNTTDQLIDANFGNGYFGTTAVSSAQNPDDGIGIFEYSVPTGYKALCTKSINAQEYS